MNVLGICGSPRRGNNEALLREVLLAAESSGAETEIISLNGIGHCLGCEEFCVKEGKCRIKDGMDDVYPLLVWADAIVVATPPYFDNVSSLAKAFIDRTNPLLAGKKLSGKRAAGVVVGSSATCVDSKKAALEALKRFFSIHKMRFLGGIVASADESVKKKAVALGKKLAG